METIRHIVYDIDKSSERMDEILNAGDEEFSDLPNIPPRDDLTYTNGAYVNIAALFIDMVGSSDMTNSHYRPTLAKIYRCFISECTAIMNGQDICKEISIKGDCVWGVFEVANKLDFNIVFDIACKLNSLIKILNYKLKKKHYRTISVGIGIDYGRALMVKAGYYGSRLNDVIWMGDVVNSACHLANKAGREGLEPIAISEKVYSKLDNIYKEYCTPTKFGRLSCYESDKSDTAMDKWLEGKCRKRLDHFLWQV